MGPFSATRDALFPGGMSGPLVFPSPHQHYLNNFAGFRFRLGMLNGEKLPQICGEGLLLGLDMTANGQRHTSDSHPNGLSTWWSQDELAKSIHIGHARCMYSVCTETLRGLA